MIKIAAAAFLLIAMVGCANHCSDGASGMGFGVGPVAMSSSSYRACHEECLDPVDPKPCGCSRQCPCWRKHQ